MAYYRPDNKADLVIDIETLVVPIQQADLDLAMEEYTPPANYKSTEAIERHKEKFKQGLVEKLVQEKRFSIDGKRMLSCAMGLVDKDKHDVIDVESWISDDLSIVTKGIVNYLDSFKEYRLIGFNHIAFDLPEIAKSFYLTGVRPKNRPSKWDLIDLNNHPFKKGGLKRTAKAFGIEISEASGADVQTMYEEGRLEDIQKYNELDVIITGKLYLAASAIFSFF